MQHVPKLKQALASSNFAARAHDVPPGSGGGLSAVNGASSPASRRRVSTPSVQAVLASRGSSRASSSGGVGIAVGGDGGDFGNGSGNGGRALIPVRPGSSSAWSMSSSRPVSSPQASGHELDFLPPASPAEGDGNRSEGDDDNYDANVARRKRQRALKAVTDAVKKKTADLGVGARFTRVPSDLLMQEVLQLKPWAVLVTDETIFTLAGHNQKVRAREALLAQMASTRGALKAFLSGSRPNSPAMRDGREFQGTRHLDLAGASEITDASISALAHVCPTLEFLSLAGCVRLTDASIRAICVANPGLLSLNLNATSPALTGTAAEAIGGVCHALRELHLRRCSWLKTWMCMRLFNDAPHLEVVDLSFCANLSDADVTVVAKRCPNLRHIDLRECCNTSDGAVMALTMHCPGLVYVALSRKDQK